MSERPFMQLYVSDFVGDTLHLSTEQIGAYMLLLMAMWNAGGKLPADDAKLARVVRMSVKKWRSISGDLMTYFDGDADHIWHNRLTKELQKSEAKSQSRAAAGAKGGASKSLKNNDADIANAKQMPKHSPDTITRDTSSLREDVSARGHAGNPIIILQSVVDAVSAQKWAQHCQDKGRRLSAAQADEMVAVLQEVQRSGGNPVEALRIAIRKGWVSLEIEWLRNAGLKFAGLSGEKPIDYLAWCIEFFKNGTWGHIGPKPGMPGCKAPPEIIEQARREAERMTA